MNKYQGPVSRFRISWVLQSELALGPAPWAQRHLLRLKEERIAGILSLCSVQEVAPPVGQESFFECRRVVLPDHRVGIAPTRPQLQAALAALTELRQQGPVFVHCVAAMERSPLICLAWLMRHRGLTRLQALDYLTELHPGTNPLPEQLALLTEDLIHTDPR